MNKEPTAHPLQHKQGGVIMTSGSNEGLNQIRIVLKAFMSQAFASLKQGQFPDLFSSVKPVTMNYPLSIMECIAMDFQYLDHYLADYYSQFPQDTPQDYTKRMQCLVTGMLGGQHVASVVLGYKPPVDPILGETLLCRKEGSGTTIGFEAIATGPHQQLYQMHGGNEKGSFKVEGSVSIQVSVNPITNKVVGRRTGKNTILLGGDTIEFSCSPMEITGVFGGDMISYYVE